MYRYQPDPTSFGAATWACHQGCHDYTTWRIVPRDVDKVPLDDAPEGWGWREQEIEVIRQLRRAEM